MKFSEWLTEKTREYGYKQVTLAEALGTQQSAVWNWLHEKGYPSDQNLDKLAELFHEDRGFLYQLMGRLPPQTANNLDLLPEEIGIFNDLIELRETRIYAATIVAMKALLDVAKTEEDSPFQESTIDKRHANDVRP